MSRFLPFVLLAAIVVFGCKSKSSSNENDDTSLAGLLTKYPALTLPFAVADSNMRDIADTTTIRYEAFMSYVPDSIFSNEFAKEKKLSIRPIGKVVKDKNTFLVSYVSSKGRAALYLTAFQKDSFAAAMPLIVSDNDRIVNTATIDKNMSVEKQKKWAGKDGELYDRTIYAYTGPGDFSIVMTETNENRITNAAVNNPLDTLPKTFKYSGDYRKDKETFVAIRDGGKTGIYKFFVHFETKGTEPCGGELKGEFKMIDAEEGVFSESGDPCVIHFKFSKNKVLVKEEGACGNHRGIKCFFDDIYRKETPAKAAKKK